MESCPKVSRQGGRVSDWTLKHCPTDRLSALPDELLTRVLGSMPTKDAAATRVLSKRMREAFTWITSLDFVDSTISHCLHHPYQIERFPCFKLFVDNILGTLSQSHHQQLTKFRLRVGGDKNSCFQSSGQLHSCEQVDGCFPDLDSVCLNLWISFPLTRRCGLRELDLCIHVRKTTVCKLPPTVFACPTLEVLKLNANLDLDVDQVSAICLPKLKLLHLCSLTLTEDDFVTRLVSSCPTLEDLAVTECWWEHGDFITISSSTLRKLVLSVIHCDDGKPTGRLHIDTPNLEYLHYSDHLASCYSITNLNALVQAHIHLGLPLLNESNEACQESMLSLIRPLSNVQNLSLLGTCLQNIIYGGDSTGRLPLLPNLKTLALGDCAPRERCDKVLWEILNSSPCLETLVFPQGLFFNFILAGRVPSRHLETSEHEFWRTIEAIPSCCQFHLKRIVLKNYFGMERELNLVKFLLQKAFVLEELLICISKNCDVPNLDQTCFENALKMLPGVSITCSIKVM